MFSIEYRPEAVRNLRAMRAFDRARVVAGIAQELSHAPHVMGGRKKRIDRDDGNFVYQLSIGEWRVFYDVDVDVRVTAIVKIKKKGRKTTGEIL